MAWYDDFINNAAAGLELLVTRLIISAFYDNWYQFILAFFPDED